MTTEESRMRDRLIALAGEAPPADLSQRILEREEFAPARRPRRPTSWRAGGANGAVPLVAAAVVAIVVSTTAIVVANRGAPAGPPSPPAASSTASPAPTTSAATEPSAYSSRASAPASLPAQARSSTVRSGQSDLAGSSAVLLARNAFPALDVQQTHPCARELPVPRAISDCWPGR